jgi:hypothetical protein
MKSMHLLLAAMLLTMATVWARAAAQGIERALVSIEVECCVKEGLEPSRISTLFGRLEFSPGLLNIESLCEENSMTCTKCNAKFSDEFYCLKCGHVPPREAKVEDSRGELKQAA